MGADRKGARVDGRGERAGRTLETLEPRRLLAAAELVADFNAVTPPSDPTTPVVAGDLAYFLAKSRQPGSLWVTDGTEGGTRPVFKVGQPGPAHISVGSLTAVGDQVFFTSYEAGNIVLWVSDGTAEGTRRVSSHGSIGRIAALGDVAVFSEGTEWSRIWRSDGTTAGTYRIGRTSTPPESFATVNGKLVFDGSDDLDGAEPWVTDGTVEGTKPLLDIYPGYRGSAPALFTAGPDGAGVAYFFASRYQTRSLWRTDGTAAGTRVVASYIQTSRGDQPYAMTTVAGGRVFMRTANQVWASDGTSQEGTVTVAQFGADDVITTWAAVGSDLYFGARVAGAYGLWKAGAATGAASRVTASPVIETVESMVSVGGRLMFRSASEPRRTSSDTPYTVWESDGTPQGTRDALPPELASLWQSGLAAVNGRTLFVGRRVGMRDVELHVTDGTPAGSRVVKDIYAEPTGDANPTTPLEVGGRLVFWVTTGAQLDSLGTLVSLDPSTGVSVPLLTSRHSPTGSGGTGFGPMTVVGGRGYFMYYTAANGYEPWVTDGTHAGTRLLTDIVPGSGASGLDLFFGGDGYTVFAAYTVGTGTELWRTDGTQGGTYPLKDMNPGSGQGFKLTHPSLDAPTELGRWGRYVFYFGYDGSAWKVWRTDGTADGTIPLIPAVPQPRKTTFTALADRMLVFQQDGLFGSDGTANGTVKLPVYASNNYPPVVWNGRAYFHGWGAGGVMSGLWVTDGTVEGTRLVRGGVSVGPGAAVDGRIRFVGHDAAHGGELWASDGTAEGTAIVIDAVPGIGSGAEVQLGVTPLGGGVVVYAGWARDTGAEMWRSDGTPSGTRIVADVEPGPVGSMVMGQPRVAGVAGGYVYFAYTPTQAGSRLWRSDGTPGGTGIVWDVTTWGSSPGYLTSVGGAAYFAATSLAYGRELWRVADDRAPVVTTWAFDPTKGRSAVTAWFNEPLGRPIGADDVSLIDLITGRAVDPAAYTVDAAPAAGAMVVRVGGTLPNGRYQLRLRAGAASDGAGNAAASDSAFDFSVLSGDVNRDGAVDFADLVVLAQHYDGPAARYADGDLNGDGRVDFEDLVLVAQGYDTALPPPPVSAGARSAPVRAVAAVAPARPVAPVARPTAKRTNPVFNAKTLIRPTAKAAGPAVSRPRL